MVLPQVCSFLTAAGQRRFRMCQSETIALGRRAKGGQSRNRFSKWNQSFTPFFNPTSCFLSALLGPYLFYFPSALASCSMLRNSSVHIPFSKCWVLGNHSNLANWPGVTVLHSSSVNSPEDNIYNLKRKLSDIVKEETFGGICEKARSWEGGGHSSLTHHVPLPLVRGNFVPPGYDQKVWLLVKLGSGQKNEIGEIQLQLCASLHCWCLNHRL